MSSIADQVRISQDKDGMLRRALERIIQLYTDRSHFIYELLQNAEDAEAKSVKFLQFHDRLEVLHDGKPFTSENLQGLCDIGKSDKADNLNQIGEFGVGFKSVFGICDTVKLYSDPSHYHGEIGNAVPFAIEILDFTRPVDIMSAPIPGSYTTKFIFPFTVGRTFSGFESVNQLSKTLSKKLQNLGITTLLFMKSLELIEYEINIDEMTVSGQYLLEKKAINDHCSLVSALGISDVAAKEGNAEEEISYLKFTRQIAGAENRTVDIAFPVIVNKDGSYTCRKPQSPYISVYFPTETESKLAFIVQGPYRTTPNRSSVPADDADNVNLAKHTAALLKDSILELRDSGKFNMSFLKALPLSERSFENYSLFRPLYTKVKDLLMREAVIPTKNGKYSFAKYSRIARQERLVVLFSDEALSDLIHDSNRYSWLPTYLTETNREYEAVYKYLTTELKIPLIRPEDLRIYFSSNPLFLPKQSDDWLVELYGMLENVGAAFSKSRSEANMLTANIVKTSTGEFVSAYRRTDGKQYLPNVFLPSDKVKSDDVHFVDPVIYERCRHFFDNILELQEPNEYEFFVRDFKKRYFEVYAFEEEQHISDIRHILKYLKNDEYKEEIRGLVEQNLVLKCTDGRMRSAYAEIVFLPICENDLNIEGYLKNITSRVSFVDIEFYRNNDVKAEELHILGVNNSLLRGEFIKNGEYHTGSGGRQPKWQTDGNFRWKLTIDYLEEAIKYISAHPTEKDSIIKSKTIFTIISENESKLCGTVTIGGSTPNLENEPCEMIKVLRGERINNWNGKWLYTESLELVSPNEVSKYDISQSIYGKPKIDSCIYDLLEFRKTDSDEAEELRKTVPQKQLDAYFENELLHRFGLSSTDLTAHFSNSAGREFLEFEREQEHPFPVANVKNWESLKKHAAEMLVFAYPVKYEYAVRRIRVSNGTKGARPYLMNMYKSDGIYKYACQMCHESCSDIEQAQIFNNPELELDPLNLCLCPNCAAVYRQIRFSDSKMETFKKEIMSLRDTDVTSSDVISFDVDGHDIWFTQIHIAEIRSLLQLAYNTQKKEPAPESVAKCGEKGTPSGYSAYVGKLLSRKDGFRGKGKRIEGEYLVIEVLKGKNSGNETKVELSFFTKNPGVYKFEDIEQI